MALKHLVQLNKQKKRIKEEHYLTNYLKVDKIIDFICIKMNDMTLFVKNKKEWGMSLESRDILLFICNDEETKKGPFAYDKLEKSKGV